MNDEYADIVKYAQLYVFAYPVSGPSSASRRLTVFCGGEADMKKWFVAGMVKEDGNIH